jgi:CNT family concentrative nucleoside transporter
MLAGCYWHLSGLIALLNGMLGWVGGLCGFDALSMQLILGWLFSPVAWLLGIPWQQATIGGSFIGQKLVVNEFVAFIEFGSVRDALSTRTQAIITFALCGFANFSSISILLGVSAASSLVADLRSRSSV